VSHAYRFLTRLHYCAADPSHEGKPQRWGEHEVDHILFIKADVDVNENPEEVAAHRWVCSPANVRVPQPLLQDALRVLPPKQCCEL
jgi:isopentenyldiphosphate isomerase